MDIASEMLLANASSGGVMPVSAALRSAPVRRRAGPISATGWLPRIIVTVSPRSTASRRPEKCRDASVAVTVRLQEGYLIIRFPTNGSVASGALTARARTLLGFVRVGDDGRARGVVPDFLLVLSASTARLVNVKPVADQPTA